MKHISQLLIPAKERLTRARQLSLFSAPSEKGIREWNTFNAIREDRVRAYPTRSPRKTIVVKGRNHVLRIVYPSTYSPRHA